MGAGEGPGKASRSGDGTAFAAAVARLVEALRGARRCVALTGAGISTESGIPDFRSPETGLWQRVDPMETLSAEAFWRDPPVFYQKALESWLPPLLQARPNVAHRALAALEAAGHLQAVITQNIDGLHQQAGSRRVLEVHGHARWARCVRCGHYRNLSELAEGLRQGTTTPYCSCGGPLKPAVVLFGEPLPPAFEEAVAVAAQADLMVVVGSSLTVDPANRLPVLAEQVAINNTTPTWIDTRAVVVVPYPAGRVWAAVADRLGLAI